MADGPAELQPPFAALGQLAPGVVDDAQLVLRERAARRQTKRSGARIVRRAPAPPRRVRENGSRSMRVDRASGRARRREREADASFSARP